MDQFLLVLVAAVTVAAVVFGVTVLVTGGDPGLVPAEPDGRSVPLPGTRPLLEQDVTQVRFDTALRGYRMAQVDQALRRAAYDIGYKDELIEVLQAEVAALRDGRTHDADLLRQARDAALSATTSAHPPSSGVGPATVADDAGPIVTVTPAEPVTPAKPVRPTPDADGSASQRSASQRSASQRSAEAPAIRGIVEAEGPTPEAAGNHTSVSEPPARRPGGDAE
ncbi:DivIVA domain-containing protein [Solwaraspora sp. WMMD406]|uniref:DivIVA domain-containing protein n=1 Tax=Solwaraspora sp. WMMD406 TaxID=3016095 RepID=UPI0024171B9F|nr:DivIVA domain-containing protein [Solwaraspora sp. WMMD406]MDG4768143.1 DivIVA domain-containing protein [Solwaraspora sp. WMMD406]